MGVRVFVYSCDVMTCLFSSLLLLYVGRQTATLERHSGYTADDLAELVTKLNRGISRRPTQQIKTIRQKYTHT